MGVVISDTVMGLNCLTLHWLDNGYNHPELRRARFAPAVILGWVGLLYVATLLIFTGLFPRNANHLKFHDVCCFLADTECHGWENPQRSISGISLESLDEFGC